MNSLINDDEDFLDKFYLAYEPQKILGQGAFSYVIQAKNIHNSRLVAIKIIEKTNKIQTEYFRREAEILSKMKHQNIVSFISCLESQRKIYLIMEIVQGVTLEKYIHQKGQLDHDDTIFIMKQILSAVHYWHEQEIIHRDLKPENIIIDHQLNIKVIDFGLSFLSKSHQLTHTNCGTLIFMAPEMVSKKQYFKSVDIWSCGIIQYILLNGRHPLWNPEIDTKDTYLEKINQPIIWDFPRNMSKLSISFFQKTATTIPEARMSAAQALSHPWITGDQLEIPLTMTDMVECFKFKQKLLGLIKFYMFTFSLKKNCQKVFNFEEDEQFDLMKFKLEPQRQSQSNGLFIIKNQQRKNLSKQILYLNNINMYRSPMKSQDVNRQFRRASLLVNMHQSTFYPQYQDKSKYIQLPQPNKTNYLLSSIIPNVKTFQQTQSKSPVKKGNKIQSKFMIQQKLRLETYKKLLSVQSEIYNKAIKIMNDIFHIQNQFLNYYRYNIR